MSRPVQSDLEESARIRATDLSFDYGAAVFGGAYTQGDALGVLLDLVGQAEVEMGIHELQLTGAYLYDPFSTKAFNFTEETPVETSARLVQWMHEFGGRLEWDADWLDWLSTGLWLGSNYRWTEMAADKRWMFELGGALHLGANWYERGPFAQLSADYFRRIYPNYRVADRSLDQQGTVMQLETGWSFGRGTDLGIAYEFRLTDYLDAQYDQLLPDGQVERANESKRYLRHALIAKTVIRPVRGLRLSFRYTFQRNDSIDYDRRMTGRDPMGIIQPRFIRDYFDYDRHWLRAGVRWSTHFGLNIEFYAGYWLRLFDTYVARDVDNSWLDETRIDHNIESGLELAYEVFEAGNNSFNFVGFASHISRRSNMEREVSFATNFDVTRIFVGFEVHN